MRQGGDQEERDRSDGPEGVRVVVAGAVRDPAVFSGLLFEYMAATEAAAGRPEPAVVGQLPGVLRAECADPVTAYRPPGELFVAAADGAYLGCVGVQLLDPTRAEVKRLWVRPAHRGSGTARLLMAAAHDHARRRGCGETVLDVLPSRSGAIAFYRRLGYVDADPYTEVREPMVLLRRPLR